MIGAAAVGLLVWLLTQHAPRWLRVPAWTVAAGHLTVCGGSWVLLGWSRTGETVAALLLGAAWTVLNAAIWSAASPPQLMIKESLTS